MGVSGAGEQVRQAALGWPGVEAHPHRFGGTEYRIAGREIGHIHGDDLLDVPFPVKVRERLVAEGRAQLHHVLPDSGWISFYLREPGDVERAIALLRESYDLAVAQRSRGRASGSHTESAA
jgi:hypothetical protein